jgi:thioredoxin 2
MAPELQKVAEARAGKLLVGKVDTDRYPELARRYSIEALPTLVLFDGPQERTRLAGALPAAMILRELAL